MATLSSSMVDVGVSLVLDDQFSSNAGKISQSYKNMMKDMDNFNRGMSMSLGTVFDKGVEAIKGMYGAFEKYASVQKDIFMVSKMTGSTVHEASSLMNLVKEINLQTPATASQIASGAKYLAMAGNSLQDINTLLPGISKMGALFQHEIGGKGGVADLLTNMMIGLDVPMSQAETVMNQVTKAVTSTNMSLTDLANSIQYAAASARTMKMPLDQVLVSIGTLGNMGIQGSRAGTEFKNYIENMSKSFSGNKKNAEGALAAIGLSADAFKDVNGNLKDVGSVAATIGEALKRQGVTSMTEGLAKSSLFYNVFGMRGKSLITDLVDQYLKGSDKFNQILQKVRDSQGFLNDTMEEYMKGPQGIADMFKASWENFIISNGQQLAKVFTFILETGTKIINIVDKIVNNPIGGSLLRVGAYVTIWRTLNAGFRMVKANISAITSGSVLLGKNINSSTTGITRMNAGLSTTVQLVSTIVREFNALSIQTGVFNSRQLSYLAAAGYSVNKAGKVYRSKGTPGAGGFVSHQLAMDALMMGTMGSLLKGSKGSQPSLWGEWATQKRAYYSAKGRNRLTYGDLFNKQGRNLIGTGVALGASMKGLGTAFKIGKLGSAAFGGPWGIAIAVLIELLTTWLPKIWGSIQDKDKDSEEPMDSKSYQIQRDRLIINLLSKAINEGKNPKNITVIIKDPNGNILGTQSVGDEEEITIQY